ncbi:hypothetical protein [Mucilaginibacter sp. 10B2]|uniref:hypothetical protein n=1 Tax=Mucilaginibacter sp. 10B2 TaxID=3048574 RepID=UPI002B22D6ED|nr:hypothetical protein [Mucilaginibacter sp. 10B2]MEB0278968.1 hypothetical protein [Mucilaginibacter sp. 10B2]
MPTLSPKKPAKKPVSVAKVKNTPSASKLSLDVSTYGLIELATSMRLKRRLVNEPYYAKLFIPAETYTWLNTLGIECGVTWDEALRGLMEMHQASADQTSGLKNFIPALQA